MTVVSLAALVFLARASEWDGFWTRLGLQTVLATGFVLPLALPWLGQQDVVIGPVVLALMLGGQLLLVARPRSEEHTSELQSLMRISYAVFCLKKKMINNSCTMIICLK